MQPRLIVSARTIVEVEGRDAEACVGRDVADIGASNAMQHGDFLIQGHHGQELLCTFLWIALLTNRQPTANGAKQRNESNKSVSIRQAINQTKTFTCSFTHSRIHSFTLSFEGFLSCFCLLWLACLIRSTHVDIVHPWLWACEHSRARKQAAQACRNHCRLH